jgi:hypothetical protein
LAASGSFVGSDIIVIHRCPSIQNLNSAPVNDNSNFYGNAPLSR